MNNCPCCSYSLLRHIRHNSVYWYCSRCHEEMPNLTTVDLSYGHYLRNKQFKVRSKDLLSV